MIRAKPVWALLNHTSGWRPFREYFQGLGKAHMSSGERTLSKNTVRKMISRDGPDPNVSKHENYSDIGYLCLEWICETIDIPLKEKWDNLPLHGVDGIHFPEMSNQGNPQYAATEACSWRKALIQGVVHDDNAWVMGGYCGHAGAFGNLKSVHTLAVQWMKAANGQANTLGLSTELVRLSMDRTKSGPRGTRVLVETPSPGKSSSGQHFGRGADISDSRAHRSGLTQRVKLLSPCSRIDCVLTRCDADKNFQTICI